MRHTGSTEPLRRTRAVGDTQARGVRSAGCGREDRGGSGGREGKSCRPCGPCEDLSTGWGEARLVWSRELGAEYCAGMEQVSPGEGLTVEGAPPLRR